MSTIAFFHAHPDDEASLTGGTMAKAAARGHRVVVIFATNGEHGSVPNDLAPGETLVQRRRREAEASAEVLGVSAVRWLGYSDSGMTGWEQNDHAGSFWSTPSAEAGQRLRDTLVAEGVDVLVGYDWHGGYGHPDHVQVHRVSQHVVGPDAPWRYLEASMNRDVVRSVFQSAQAAGETEGFAAFDPDSPMDDGNPLGTPGNQFQWAVDVTEFVETKRAALACHASQAGDVTMLLDMPADHYAVVFGCEYFMEPALNGAPMSAAWPF